MAGEMEYLYSYVILGLCIPVGVYFIMRYITQEVKRWLRTRNKN